MAAIILPQRHYRQPQGRVEIASAWADGLDVAINPPSGLHNLCYGATPVTVHGTPALEATGHGVGVGGFSSTSYLSFTDPSKQVTDGASVFALMQNRSTANQGLWTLTSATETGNQDHLPFSSKIYTSSLSASRWVNGSNIPGGVNELLKPFSVAARRKSYVSGQGWPEFRFYLNDTFVAEKLTNNLSSALGSTFAIGANLQSALYYIGAVSQFLFFTRELSVDEVRSLHENPWQVFRADPVRIYSLAAATIPTLSAPGVTDIGSSSVRPQITLTF